MAHASLLYFAPHHVFPLYNGFACCTGTSLVPVFPFPAPAFLMCPHSSDNAWYRNLNLLSIAYVLRPVLRPRLTQGRSALPWNLGYSAERIPTFLSLLIPAFSLLIPPLLLPVLLLPGFKNAPLPLFSSPRFRCRVSAPDIFGAGLSTSELLRTL